jgi:tRNA pseudouridine38-40 synthase
MPEVDKVDTMPPGNMHKWRMVIAYDGTKFKGLIYFRLNICFAFYLWG